MDATHNPEFTTCEFYQAYTNINDLLLMTESLLREVVVAITGTPEFTYAPVLHPPVKLDFSGSILSKALTTTLDL